MIVDNTPNLLRMWSLYPEQCKQLMDDPIEASMAEANAAIANGSTTLAAIALEILSYAVGAIED